MASDPYPFDPSLSFTLCPKKSIHGTYSRPFLTVFPGVYHLRGVWEPDALSSLSFTLTFPPPMALLRMISFPVFSRGAGFKRQKLALS